MDLLQLLNKWGFFLIVTTLFVSCHSQFGENASAHLPDDTNTTCKRYLKSLPSFWNRNDRGYYEFVTNSSTIYGEFVQNTNTCFQGFSVEMLKKYLGEPNVETPVKLTYYVTEACLTRDRDCNIQVFKIENGFFKETLLVSPKPFGVD
jgi:hypothetical protein